MLTLQHVSRQLHCGFYDVTLLPGALVRVEGSDRLTQRLMHLLTGRAPLKEANITFADIAIAGDTEYLADVMFLPFSRTAPWRHKHLTADAYLQKWVNQHGFQELLASAIHFFQLNTLLNKRLYQLSVSEWRRVYYSRLLLNPCAIWLLEKPLLGIEDTTKEIIETLIAGRCKQNGIVFFSHSGETRLNPHHVAVLLP